MSTDQFAVAAEPGHPVDPVIDWAGSGIVALTGESSGPPLVPPGRAATVAQDISARLAVATGKSQNPVRVDGARLLSERAAFTGHRRRGRVSAGGRCRLLPTADGWAAVSCARPDDPALLGALVGAELPEDSWPGIAAWLAEHTGDELTERATPLGIAAGPVRAPGTVSPAGVSPPRPGPPRSVAGLLVVDFSALWAGPLCAHLLGLAGARVVKVETPSRPDGARRGNPEFYRLLHAGHRSVVLDPGTAGGRRALAGLVEAADIVIEASRPRALARFGLDAEAYVDSGTVWVSITAHGRASDRIGFGDDLAATSGLVAWDAGGGPLFCGDALADPLTGLVAAELAMTAPIGGAGMLFDLPMSAVVGSTLDGNVGSPSSPARREGSGWVMDTAAGPVPVALPRRRPVTGRAPASGQHTGEVLSELGIPAP
ncbi:MAG: acyl-CoA transferase/carnitine dehydratase [Streptosporangiaceae bacterium]|nr:acyl-CoA transferase/carnitine dehydratase [Streptosporangiaceae bacterium]